MERKTKNGSMLVPPRKYLGNDSPQLEIKQTVSKGKGVFAASDIPANSRIPYKGESITTSQYRQLVEEQREGDNDLTNYIAGSFTAPIDAHPRIGLFINAFGNEPWPGETANMILTTEIFHKKTRPVFITVREIKTGDELTAKYGSGYVRKYKVGKAAPRPQWWKQRAVKPKF